MKLGLFVTTLLLGANMAQASTVLLAECLGSIVEGNYGENYAIRLNTEDSTGASELVVDSQYIDGFSIKIPASKRTVKINSAETLVASASKRSFGITSNKKTLVIDFVTGKGKATSYEPLDSLLKARIIYLNYCTRR